MNSNISAWSIRTPIPSLVLFAVLMLVGTLAFMRMPITRFPNIDVPVVSIVVTQSGAAPAELETQVTKRIEDSVAGVPGVKHIVSNVTDGTSTTLIEFRLEVNSDRALNDVKDAVAKVRAELPRTVDEPIVQRVDVEGQAILSYAVTAPARTLEQLSWFVDDTVKRGLQGLRGVGRVDRIGGVTREIQVSLDPDRLAALGLTAGEVNRQVRATNVDLAGGRGEVGGQEQSIRTLAGARTLDDLRNTRIVLPGGREARLSDLATVTDAFEEPRSFARIDGTTPVVAFSVFRAKGASDYDVKRVVEAQVEALRAANPGFGIEPLDDSVRYTYGNYKSAMQTLVEGALLAVVVVFLFLRDWRATLIAAAALPLSVVPTFFALELLGFSLNLVSLLAITLVTGILVDDAIVEIENIERHMAMGKTPYRAATEAADEIGLAVIAISLTIIAIFAPVSFMGGIAGQYFKQFGLTVAISVFFSLMVARLITPMMAAYLMRQKPHREARDGFIMRAYTGFLGVTVRHRFLTMLVGLGLFAVSAWSTTLLPTGFVPPEDSARVVVSLEMPPGSTLADTRAKTDEAVRAVQAIPEVRRVFVIGGSSPTGTREIRRASLYVLLTPKTERARKQKQVEGDITARLGAVPDMRAFYVNERGERELAVTIVGTDPAALDRGVASVEAAMRRRPEFANVAAGAGLARPEIRVTPRIDEAARLGVTTEAISEAVRVATIGDVGPNLAKFNLGDRLVPIRVQFETDARRSLDALETATVTNAAGLALPLSAVAEIGFSQGPSSVERYDRTRRVVIGADLRLGTTLGQAVEIVNALPELQTLPPGVSIQRTGDAEIMAEVFGGFAQALGIGLVCVFGVLVLLFGSVFHPITILLSLPLSLGGVFLGLLLTGNPISMPVVIGILMLFGIVTKNAIMLVDFAIEQEARGVERNEAIIDAGRKRARPIVMTTIAMVAGMVPTALGYGDGGEFRAPMAIAVIGGLVVSTVLSLVFVPSFYVVMDAVSGVAGRIFGRFVGPKEDLDAGPASSAPPPALHPVPVRLAAE